MQKENKDELKAYVQKMYLRGDSYTDMYSYLSARNIDKDLMKQIILEVESENKKEEKKETSFSLPLSIPTIILAIALMVISQISYSKGITIFPIRLLGLLGIFLLVKEVINWLVLKYWKK